MTIYNLILSLAILGVIWYFFGDVIHTLLGSFKRTIGILDVGVSAVEDTAKRKAVELQLENRFTDSPEEVAQYIAKTVSPSDMYNLLNASVSSQPAEQPANSVKGRGRKALATS